MDGLIFDVKGFVHPPDRIVAYLRYLEEPSGDRRRGDKTYVKVYSLSERDRIIREKYPQYLFYDPVFGEYLEGVPHNAISKIYEPAAKVLELVKKPHLDQVEIQALEFLKILHDSSNVGKLGLSGSILVGLHTENSDIDVIVYGRKNCLIVYESLTQLMQEGKSVTSYSSSDLKRLYGFRFEAPQMPLEDFIRIERRKVSQGRFRGRDFFVRFLLDWDEVDEKYGDRIYTPCGYAKIRARVEDDLDSIFTPCRYEISQVEVLEGTNLTSITEIASFRGKFCEQAKKGEKIIAQGKVEKVIYKNGAEYFRLILGAKPSDFMMSKEA
ncbi:nucleotidyltransferase domain-containing protein [Candidatus Bathyarchaeota archaeon]|nr:nucleotidyltransferase domain-containing protein [Candidatus Bathyarchaeota archaeon]